VNAIKMSPNFELACYSRKDVFYTKDRLVEAGDKYLGRKKEGTK
jgi:formate hydrogenlyase subunit 6/NADH:ubiquinone oxidoreductase subunit I